MKRYLLILTLSLPLAFVSKAQDSTYQLALIDLIGGNYDAAYSTLQTCATSYREAGNSERYALCHLKMSECLIRSSQYASALDQLVRIDQFIAEDLFGNAYLTAETKRLQGEVYLNQGKLDQALEMLVDAEQSYPDNAALEKAEAYNLLGIIYWNNLNRSLALQYHQEALKLRQQKLSGESIKVADSYNNIGLIYLNDDPTQARKYLNNALQIYEAQLGTLNPKVAFVLLNLAQTSGKQFRFTEAEKYVDQVQQIWKNIYSEEDHPNIAFTTAVLGQIKADKGELDQSLIIQQAALQQYIRLFGAKHPDVANQHQIIGKVYRAMDEYGEAIHAFQSAIYANLEDQQFVSIYDTPEIASYFHADYLLSALMDKASALEALHLSKTLKQRELKAAIATYIAADQLIEEIRKYRVSEADKLLLGATSRQLYESGSRLGLILGEQPFQANKYFPQVYDFIEKSKAAVLQQAIQDTKAKSFAGIPPAMIDLEDSIQTQLAYHQQKLAAGEAIDFHKQQIFNYQTAYRNFVEQLELDYPNYYQLKYKASNRSVADIQEILAADECLIQYLVGKDLLFIFSVTKEAIDIHTVQETEVLTKNVVAFKNALKYQLGSSVDSIGKILQGQLIPSLGKEINKLYLLPDGLLNTFPFEALKHAKTNRYLIEDYSISYAFAGSMIAASDNPQEVSSAGLFAPISFNYAQESLPRLQGTNEELLQLGVLFKSFGVETNSFRNLKANETVLKSEASKDYSILHLATHGKVNQSSPELSRLYLKADKQNDGILYSGELYNLQLNADLVALSACETGLGKIQAGEGIVGLSRALLYAGASNLVVSLWTVSDVATAQLMTSFYSAYFSSGENSWDKAIRSAKLSMIRSENFSDPYFWSPFILIGQ